MLSQKEAKKSQHISRTSLALRLSQDCRFQTFCFLLTRAKKLVSYLHVTYDPLNSEKKITQHQALVSTI
jgi:hypothetical protein